IAYFEHSMDPDADPYDPASWEFHPGLDGLISLEDLAAEADPKKNTHADFLRGFMNVPTKVRDVTVLDLDAWADLAGDLTTPEPAQIAYAYDVAIDRSGASVWQAWRDARGRLNLAVLETRPGADWLPDFVGNLAATGAHVAADDGGPALATALEAAVERYGGDAKWLSRRRSLGPMDPLIAAIVAAWTADRLVSTAQIW